ncbi:SGNH/GDSL hydrolase family protein [Hymenobacter fodinae]|uniref:SGNH/GDSL hydrolase family protein n=1 Tax=Hymenobacter fodinae TaxID=2510796 RepID=A0A4Z0PDS3_9BACT|nr:GDSL-type esterase/lipase family protein [Hymenobacter fodinae]TGE10622.1 SGNH/GDSL hydrolase family protein [Hymenobacter fodinae]
MRSFLLLFMLLGFSCGQPSSDPAPSTTVPGPPTSAGNAVSFLSLGDSYTIGEGVPEADRWSVQLAQLGQAEGLLKPDIIARTGWTTAELQAAIKAANVQKTYGLVSLLIGVNNQYRGQPLATYRTEFRELLQIVVRLAGNRPGRVLVLSIPDWGQTPYARGYDQARIGAEIDQFNAAAEQECQQAQVAYLAITDLTRAAANDPTQFTSDGLHYSGKHMRQWADQALPVVRTLLR